MNYPPFKPWTPEQIAKLNELEHRAKQQYFDRQRQERDEFNRRNAR